MSYYNYEDEQFYEPTGYEEQLGALVTQIRSNIKSEVIHELETLRAENERLQDIKQRMSNIDREHQRKLNELESAKRDVMGVVRKERIRTLLDPLWVRLYRAENKYIKSPKCDKCDAYRRVKFTTPLGRTMDEYCECNESSNVYEPKELVCVELECSSGKVKAWYQPSDYEDSDHLVSSNYMQNLYDGKGFENIESEYKTFFETEEECQAYCWWLDENETKK